MTNSTTKKRHEDEEDSTFSSVYLPDVGYSSDLKNEYTISRLQWLDLSLLCILQATGDNWKISIILIYCKFLYGNTVKRLFVSYFLSILLF